MMRAGGCLLVLCAGASAQMPAMHHDHAMHAPRGGMVMNANPDRLPAGCDEVSGDYELVIEAGAEFATRPGMSFGYSRHEIHAPPCSRLHVTLANRDAVRHQWMVHGLPRTLYPGGMFHLEADGGQSVTGRFIVPAEDHSYLVHCDMAQHMEKGMKAQLVVGRGSGDLWSIPGVSRERARDTYLPRWAAAGLAVALLAGLLLGGWLARRGAR